METLREVSDIRPKYDVCHSPPNENVNVKSKEVEK